MRKHLTGLWLHGSITLVLSCIIFLFGYVFAKGSGAISWQFLTDVPRGSVIGSEGGILPAITGSLRFTGLAVAAAIVPAVATAAWLTFFCRGRRLAAFIRGIIQCIAGIPSIVLGLFGYSLLVLTLGLGRSVLSGGLTLAVMILPFLEVRAEKAMRELPAELIRSSDALGVSSWYTMCHVILPACRGELISGTILGACYAMGATAPLIFTGAVINAPASGGLGQPAMALPYHLYMLLTQGTSTENAYGTAFVLMAILLAANVLATCCSGRRKHKWNRSSN